MKIHFLSLVVSSFIFTILSPLFSPTFAQAPVTYYIDCINGVDTNNGTSASSAWKTLTKANTVALRPGEKLLLKRGCTWTGPLNAKWSGTAANPITIGAYGTGALPIIKNANTANVMVSGDYQIIEYIHATHDLSNYTETYTRPTGPTHDKYDDPLCKRPFGHKPGFYFNDSSSYNTLRYSEAYYNSVGVDFSNNSSHNRVVNNYLWDNLAFHSANADGGNPIGAMGVLLHGFDHEIAYNRFETSFSQPTGWCQTQDNSIELYRGIRNKIHHNVSFGDRVFSETGSAPHLGPEGISEDNVYAYNLHVTHYKTPRFVVLRGAGDPFGPVNNTKIYHNTIYYTASTDTTGISCGGCDAIGTTIRNNIIKAHTPIFGPNQASYVSNNITSNFGFVNATTDPAIANFQLTSASPARNTGTTSLNSPIPIIDILAADLDEHPVPQEGTRDIGSYEFGTASITPTTTPSPTPNLAALSQPIVTLLSTCLSGPVSAGDAVQISWNNPTNPVTIVDISASATDWSGRYNKNVSGLTSTTAPAGFDFQGATVGALTLSPGVPYYVRLYNGTVSPEPHASFSIPLCGPAGVPGDIDGSPGVTITDLSLLLSSFGGTTSGPADINGDGSVSLLDLSILLSNFGK